MASCRTPTSLIGETATYTSGSHSVTWRLVFIVQLKTSFLLGGGSRHKLLHLWLRRSLLERGSTLTGFTFMPAIRGRRIRGTLAADVDGVTMSFASTRPHGTCPHHRRRAMCS